MDIEVKIYSCNWLTYRKVYKRAVALAFAKDGIAVNKADIRHTLVRIPGATIQQQRHASTEHSRTLRVYVDGTVRYVIALSNTNFDEDKRAEAEANNGKYRYGVPNFHSNTYLNQGINKIMDTFFRERKDNAGVRLFFYLLDTGQGYCSSLSNLLNYRKMATVGIEVLNLDDIDRKAWAQLGMHYGPGTGIAYTSFIRFLNDMAFVSSKHKGNIPAYVRCVEEEPPASGSACAPHIAKYVYTFKGLGAEAYDCFLVMWTLTVLARREKKTLEFLFAPEKYGFRLGQAHPRFTQNVPATVTALFRKLGLDIRYESTDEVMQQLEREDSQFLSARKNGVLRNQEMFRNAMRAKGMQTKCCLCGCEVESILEAAHLWGVASIRQATPQMVNRAVAEPAMAGVVDADSKYAHDAFYKRYMLANSGHNGVWLCRNHHGLFDSHHFIFDTEQGKVIVTAAEASVAQYVTDSVHQRTLAPDVLTPQTKTFLKYANARTVHRLT